MWWTFIIGFVLGGIIGAACALVVASERIKEIENSWYEICSRITDGHSRADAIKEVTSRDDGKRIQVPKQFTES